MPKVFGHSACSCPGFCYILHLIQIKWINFSLCCIVYPVGFLLAIPPLPTDVFQCEGHLFVFPLLWGLMDGCAVVPAIRGGGKGGGVVQFIGWLPKVKASV